MTVGNYAFQVHSPKYADEVPRETEVQTHRLRSTVSLTTNEPESNYFRRRRRRREHEQQLFDMHYKWERKNSQQITSEGSDFNM